jgi:cellulose synthase/poly-beta-1,6-N-acetylglucosamine synthase-like glycosyltransferase
MAKSIFVVSTLLLLYNYLIYPILALLIARWCSSAAAPVPGAGPGDRPLPSVALIIAAYNEERVIDEKLRNSLALDYPGALLSIVVVSDGSTDSTPAIVHRYRVNGVRSLHQPPRLGKTAAINRAVASTNADIIVFSDANNMFEPEALRELVKHFDDPTVGGVCGLKQIYNSPDRESTQGDSLYWKYESAIKEAESQIYSITTADGEIFALRHALYEPLDDRVVNDDAELTLLLVRKGYRVLYERKAISYEHASIRIEDDFHVKVRMVSGGFQTVARHWRFLLLPTTWFAIAFVSHKLLRWLAPELLLLVALSSIWLADRPFFLVMVLLQAIFYFLALTGWITRNWTAHPVGVYVPFYFCVMNLAALRGLWRFLAKTQTTQWRKAER